MLDEWFATHTSKPEVDLIWVHIHMHVQAAKIYYLLPNIGDITNMSLLVTWDQWLTGHLYIIMVWSGHADDLIDKIQELPQYKSCMILTWFCCVQIMSVLISAQAHGYLEHINHQQSQVHRIILYYDPITQDLHIWFWLVIRQYQQGGLLIFIQGQSPRQAHTWHHQTFQTTAPVMTSGVLVSSTHAIQLDHNM